MKGDMDRIRGKGGGRGGGCRSHGGKKQGRRVHDEEPKQLVEEIRPTLQPILLCSFCV